MAEEEVQDGQELVTHTITLHFIGNLNKVKPL